MPGGIPKRIIVAFVLLICVFLIGTFGYVFIENWSIFDSFYMTVITLTTVGYGEVRPLDGIGRIFTIFLLLSGFGILTYGITSGISFLLEGELGSILRRRKMEKIIEKMKHHYIICAMGETGIYVIEEFIKTKNPLVIITTDKRITERFTPHGIPMIEDNPDEDETLKKAGIDRAVGLVAVLGEDKDNLFVVLSARGLNPDCKIVAQAIESDTVAKLQKAGADEVVLTDMIGGMRIASVMLRAKVVTFLDSMLKQPGEVLRVEEATVQEGSYLDAKTIEKSEVTKRTGLVIIATREHASGKFIHNPKPDYQIKAGDTLIVIGTPDQVNELKKLAHHPESA